MHEKKKVAIITLPLRNYNYGGILQNYALQQYLMQNFDVEVETIDYQFLPKESLFRRFKMLVHKTIYKGYYQFRKKTNQHLEDFITSEIHLTSPLHSSSKITEYIKKKGIDLLITGSDQVWRLDYAGIFYPQMFLNFDDELKCRKISYAASFGFDEWKFPEKTKEIQNYFQDFDAISVRENSGEKILKNTFGEKAQHLLDPTLLLDKNHYHKLLSEFTIPKKKEKKILYAYILDIDADKEEKLNNIAYLLNVDLKKTELLENKLREVNNHNYKQYQNLNSDSIEEWLAGFYQADYIITDSFHGTVFSIIFNKPFIAIGNEKRGMSRFESLLSSLDLAEHLCSDFDETEIIKYLQKPIDYTKVETKINKEKEKSRLFLSENIEY